MLLLLFFLLIIACWCCGCCSGHYSGNQASFGFGSNIQQQQISDRGLFMRNGSTSVRWRRGEEEPRIEGDPGRVSIRRLGNGTAVVSIRNSYFAGASICNFRYL